mmetsp:Transcript_9515/g.26088  ORF Transcript_9515/g.26088 Transcript_9515/m.26088 type:complete len:82 (-) Transcript_9515:447-692(-)
MLRLASVRYTRVMWRGIAGAHCGSWAHHHGQTFCRKTRASPSVIAKQAPLHPLSRCHIGAGRHLCNSESTTLRSKSDGASK